MLNNSSKYRIFKSGKCWILRLPNSNLEYRALDFSIIKYIFNSLLKGESIKLC